MSCSLETLAVRQLLSFFSAGLMVLVLEVRRQQEGNSHDAAHMLCFALLLTQLLSAVQIL